MTVRRAPGCPVDFDDYAETEAAIAELIGDLTRPHGPWRFRDICLDTTSGTKVASIAMAVVTMNEDLEFSYVTGQGQSLVFDARVQQTPVASD